MRLITRIVVGMSRRGPGVRSVEPDRRLAGCAELGVEPVRGWCEDVGDAAIPLVEADRHGDVAGAVLFA